MMDNDRKYLIFLIIWVLASAYIHLSGFGGENHDIITYFDHILTGCVAVFFGIRAVRRSGVGSIYGKSFLLFTICVAFWTIGNILWWFVFQSAVVSFCDVLWLGGYPLIFFGILYALQNQRESIINNKIRLLIAVAVIVLFGIFYLRNFPLSWNPGVSDLENVATIGYVLADLFMIIPLVLLVTFVIGGESTVSWIFVTMAFANTMIQDMIYVGSYNAYIPGDVVDFLGVITYSLLAFSFLFYKSTAKQGMVIAQDKPPEDNAYEIVPGKPKTGTGASPAGSKGHKKKHANGSKKRTVKKK